MNDDDERRMASREAYLPPIKELLLRADPSAKFSGTLVVDLDDLISTMSDIQRDLAALIAERQQLSPRKIRAGLHQLEIALEQDLSWIVADVLPVLKDIRSRPGPVLRARRMRRSRP